MLIEELRRYACDLTLDPSTATKNASVSEGNRKVTWRWYPLADCLNAMDHRVLSREPLIGRCYWEWEGSGLVAVGVAYKSTSRYESVISFDKVWCLMFDIGHYSAWHNTHRTPLPVPVSDSNRVGVYVDREAGIVCFFSIASETHTHLHTFKIPIRPSDEPLHVVIALWAGFSDSSTSVSLM